MQFILWPMIFEYQGKTESEKVFFFHSCLLTSLFLHCKPFILLFEIIVWVAVYIEAVYWLSPSFWYKFSSTYITHKSHEKLPPGLRWVWICLSLRNSWRSQQAWRAGKGIQLVAHLLSCKVFRARLDFQDAFVTTWLTSVVFTVVHKSLQPMDTLLDVLVTDCSAGLFWAAATCMQASWYWLRLSRISVKILWVDKMQTDAPSSQHCWEPTAVTPF